TYLEGWGLKNGVSMDAYAFLELKQPVLNLLSPAKALRSPDYDVGKLLDSAFHPSGEAKEIGNFCLELARTMGGGIREKLPYRDTRDFVMKTLTTVPGFDIRRDLEILQSDGVWTSVGNSEAHSGIGRTATSEQHRVSLSSDIFSNSSRISLPGYHPISSLIRKGENEFILTTFKQNTWAAGTANSKWIREIQHENPVWIHSETADRLGIKNGERVRIVSPIGSLVTRALRTSRIHPESVALAEGMGHTALGNIAKAKPFKSADLDTQLLWWAKEGNGVNPNTIVTREAHSIGGGRLYKDTIVKIEKL
ncbi:MAG: hypothetical protein JXB23_13500, partial [Candidatus Aminicenantes bacterium]|nr:hypothetical protein [Candidatus Aminicenantes bacterium]